MRRYDAAGLSSGEEVISTDGQNPSVAVAGDGDVVLAWNSYSFGPYVGVERFDSTGRAVGWFNASPAGANPSVAVGADGTALLTWWQWGGDLSTRDIHAQRFDASNQPLGPEFRVNTFVGGDQLWPAVAANAAGGFVVAWGSFGQDGSGWGVYGQRFGEGGVPPPPTISVGDVSVAEGDTGTTLAVFAVSLSGAGTTTVTVDYATADAGARAGSDYVAASGTLTFAAGETSKSVAVAVRGDLTDEFDQGFTLNLRNATNADVRDGQALATILDDDAPPVIAINDVSRSEGHSGATAFTFTVSLSAASEKMVWVNFSTANGTATTGFLGFNSDYLAASGALMFDPGQTSATIVVQVIGDRRKEANEYFLVNLFNVSNARIGDGQGRGNILNDD
jgi:hypothetical protein